MKPKSNKEEYQEILAAARRSDGQVRMAARVGSVVYGTATPDSDRDFILVLHEPTEMGDLIIRKGLNITVRGSTGFCKSVSDGNIFALECLFAPEQHVFKRDEFPVHVDHSNVGNVVLSAISRADSDFSKGIKTGNSKKIYHAFRVLEFTKQILNYGAIVDFTKAQHIYETVMTEPLPMEEAFSKEFSTLTEELRHSYM